MSKNIEKMQQIEQNRQLLDCSRQSISRFGLSATVGVVFSFSATQAYANNTNFTTSIPTVIHVTQHATPVHTLTPTTSTHTSTSTHSNAAQSATVTHFNKSGHGASTQSTAPITNLDLSSTKANVSASLLGNFKTITLDVGGKVDVVNTSSKLTEAETLAAQQIINGGSQTVLLNLQGAADGGTVALNAALLKSLDTTLGGALTSINIPKKVTVDDSLSNLTLSGQLSNSGAIVAQAAGGAGTAISAASIVNSGTITGKNSDLLLTAPVISNSGTIGNTHNVTINTNSLDNAGGTIAATQTVNLGNNGNLTVAGGTINSPTLNLNAGSGTLAVNETRMTGVVNDVAGSAHINALGNYTMGTSSVLNDPLFSSTGNFTITSAVTATNGNDLSIVAGGSIFSAANASLNTSSTVGNGGNLLMVAGANFTVDPTTGNLTITQSTLPGGGSATGGSINLTGTQAGGAPISLINTSSSTAQGGTVTLVAYAGSAAGSGSVLMPVTSTIQTGVTNSSSNPGSVNVFAGGKSGTTISLGNISASGAGNTGLAATFLDTATPVASANGVMIDGTSGTVLNSSNFSTSSLAAFQPANISVGNISEAGREVSIQAGGTVAFKTIDVSGYGGSSGAGALGSDNTNTGNNGGQGGLGGNGGAVFITAGTGITGGSIIGNGGGGGGGGGANSQISALAFNGGDGGAGGYGGTVTLNTSNGNITLSGTVNTSGGGGGGGGGGTGPSNNGSGTPGAGGSGGYAGSTLLSSTSGSVNVAQGIYAVDGASGGEGAIYNAGGGGGSYGGGGGGGGGAVIETANTNAAGGGGGILGGNGGTIATGTSNASVAGNGGAGGGVARTGQSAPAGTAGSFNSGGNGVGSPASGGALGNGGTGAFDNFNPGAAGSNVINSDTVQGTPVSLISSTGVGTATTPLFVLSYYTDAAAPKGSIYVNAGAGQYFSGLQSASTGTVSLAAAGDLTLGANITASTVNLTTTPTATFGSGSIKLDNITATKAVTLTAGGTGTISTNNDIIITPTLIANSGSGAITLNPLAGNQVGSFGFSTTGSSVYFTNQGNLSLKTSSDTAIGATVNISSAGGSLAIGGAITSGGTTRFAANTGIAVNSQITAPGGFTLITTTGTITAPSGFTNSGPISLAVQQGSLGTLNVSTPSVSISANAATITDAYTGPTTLSASPSSSFYSGNFVFNSASSLITVSQGAVENFASITIKDTSATGGIALDNSVIYAPVVTLSTVGGNITTVSPTTVNPIGATTLNLATQSGNITALGGGQLQINAFNLTVNGSSTLSTINLYDYTSVNVTSAIANNFGLQDSSNISIAGKITAPTINLTSNNIFQTTTSGSVSGNSVLLSASNSITSNTSAAGINLSLTGTAPTLTVFGNTAAIQSTGAINFASSTLNTSLNVTASAVTVNGTLFAENLNILTPATGTLTVAAGGTINSRNQYLQVGTINLATASGNLAAGVLETTNGGFPGSITIANPTAALTIGGGGTLGATQNLTLTSGGNINIANLNYTPSVETTITAKGTVNLPASGILNASFDGIGNGGVIAITTSGLLVNGQAASGTHQVTFNANGESTEPGAVGGSISLTLTGSAATNIGGANGSYMFNASGVSGGNGGSIFVKTAGALNVADTSASVFNNGTGSSGTSTGGNGGNLSLLAGTNLSIVGNLASAPGASTGFTWGNITLGANGSTPFQIGSTSTPVNGITGTISGGNITITNTSGVVDNSSITVNAVTGQPSPTLTLNTNSISGTGSISNSSALAINSTSNLNLGALGTGGYGNITSLTLNAKGNVSVPADLLNTTHEDYVSLTSTGTLTLPTNQILVTQNSSTNSGGTIYINAPKQNYAAGVTAPNGLTLLAKGTAGTTGGIVSYILGGTTAINVGENGTATPTVEIAVFDGTTSGGTVNIQNAGAITLGANGINTDAGIDNNLSLISTGSTVFITSNAQPLNINNGNLTLETNSATTLSVGGASTNGIASNGTLDTGTFAIGNLGGAVLFNYTVNANVATPPTSGYAATVFAKTNITESALTNIVTGPSISLQTTTGSIGTAATNFVINGTNNSSATGTNVSLVSGSTGVINVLDNSSNGDVLTSTTSGSQFAFSGGGALATAGALNESTSILLNAPGEFTQGASAAFSTKTLNFSLGTMTTPLYTNATIIGGANGEALVTGTASTNPTINIIDTTTATLTLGTAGASGVAISAQGGTISITSGGSIVLNNTIGGGTTSATSTSLTAGANGTITEATGANVIGTSAVALSSANLGTATNSFNVSGGTFLISSKGIVNINDNLGGASSAIQGAAIQNVSGTVSSFSFNAQGPITLNNISATGNIIVKDTSITGSGGITTNAGTQLVSQSGAITLSSNNSASSGGNLNLLGNIVAPNVSLTAGTGSGSGITLGGNVGTGTGTVALIATGGDIIQTNGTTLVSAKTLNFNAQDIYGGSVNSPGIFLTNANFINQSGTSSGFYGINFYDTNTTTTTLSALSTTGSGVFVEVTTGGNLITTGSIVAGNTAVPGTINLTAGQNMTLGGNVGIAGINNITDITVGNNGIGTPSPAASGGLIQSAGTSILGGQIAIDNGFTNGSIGTTTTAVNTSATSNLSLNANGIVNVSNSNTNDDSGLLLNVTNAQSVHVVNSGTSDSTVTIVGISATANGGGSINVTTNNGLEVGYTGGDFNSSVTSSSGSISLTGNGVNVVSGTIISAPIGTISITSSGQTINISPISTGAVTTLNSGKGISIGYAPQITSISSLGDNVSLSANTSGNIAISGTEINAGDNVNLTATNGSVVLSAGSDGIFLGSYTSAAIADRLTAGNGNVQLTATGTSSQIMLAKDVISATGSGASGGQVVMNAGSNLYLGYNAATGTNATITATNSTNPSAAGISLSGSQVNIAILGGPANLSTNGNIAITANGGAFGGVYLGTVNSGTSLTTVATGANTGNITIKSVDNTGAASGLVQILGTSITAQNNLGANSANLTISGGTVNLGDFISLQTQALGAGQSGNIAVTSAGALTIGQASNIQTSNGTNGNITLSAGGGALQIGDTTNINSALSLNLSSNGGDLTLGNASGGGMTLQASNGNVNITTDVAHTIEVGQNASIGAIGVVGQGNVTFTVGTPPVATPDAVVAGGNIAINNVSGGTVTTTDTGFNTAGTVTFILKGANISLGNSGGNDQITFDGIDTVTADPPSISSATPMISVLPQAQILTLTTPTTTSLHGADNQNAASITSGAHVNTAENQQSTVNGITSVSTSSVQTEIGNAASNTAQSHTTEISANSIQPVSTSLSTGSSVSALSDAQAAGILQTTNVSANSPLTKMLSGGISSGSKSRANKPYVVRELPEGALLVAPERTTVVPTPFGQVQVASRSLALVVSKTDGLSVYNLDDACRGSVLITVNGETVTLEPGRHITVTHKNVESFEQVNPAQYVAYRNVRSRALNGEMKAYYSEFNHYSAIQGLEPLRAMVNSNDPVQRKIGQRMLKTSALLQLLSKDATPFEVRVRPAVTAMK